MFKSLSPNPSPALWSRCSTGVERGRESGGLPARVTDSRPSRPGLKLLIAAEFLEDLIFLLPDSYLSPQNLEPEERGSVCLQRRNVFMLWCNLEGSAELEKQALWLRMPKAPTVPGEQHHCCIHCLPPAFSWFGGLIFWDYIADLCSYLCQLWPTRSTKLARESGKNNLFQDLFWPRFCSSCSVTFPSIRKLVTATDLISIILLT